MRRKFDESGKFVDQHGEYPIVVREIAKQYNINLIDMHASSQKVIEQQGIEGSKKIFKTLVTCLQVQEIESVNNVYIPIYVRTAAGASSPPQERLPTCPLYPLLFPPCARGLG
jgi:hypothetical protein